MRETHHKQSGAVGQRTARRHATRDSRLWINKYRVARQGAARWEKRSNFKSREHFREGRNAALRPDTQVIRRRLK
jgi:hypothetical protein